MRSLFVLLLLLPVPVLAGGGVPVPSELSASPTQNNNNQAIGQSSSNQTNESRSESIGGNLNNYQINNSQGEFGEMMIGLNAISCESPSFYANAGVIPQDAYGFYLFDDRRREMMYAPQAQVGIQLPFGPQVASCVEAIKDQALQVKIGTEAGTVTKCLQVKKAAADAGFELVSLRVEYPVLTDKCRPIWTQ